ncbi:protein translocase subunit secY/sec61 alpha [Ferrithrix thermotolerans DSM 19514]|uniref:Protein translocase subunit SecY n=1 Tax=Ferrithrix thermotolerans DSM 19514 TaxID=1121881 RepID=A0A1M4SUB7_9ACTN|nr:preprotein translocase subunit SecY [Ferrithrix thermotolerans]SHE35587.1 protein translocase subunit secY/sec61 alpha [Ferrithrix thermotolerans DSM 19514]
MLSSLKNVFRVPDLRNKLLFTLLIIALYQLGANIPVPGIDFHQIQTLESQVNGGVFGFLNLFSGGAIARAALFGLGVMPYITSSIIIQLLTTVIPKLEEWRDQGAVGEKKITQTTRYLTIALALMQATGLAFIFHDGGTGLLSSNGRPVDLIPHFTVPRVLFIVLTLTAGTALVMWMGELVTQRGIGQGMSILIFANVVASLPSAGRIILADAGVFKFVVVFVVAVAILVAIVFVEQGQRRIPVVFARRVVGRKMYEGGNSYIPLKVNQAGVIPIIFASSILYFPVLLASIIPWAPFRSFVNNHLVSSTSLFYISIYGVLIVMFTFFYVQVSFDPHQQSEIIRKQGGYIQGVRPGPNTERYLGQILNRITFPGALFLAAVALIPAILLALWHVNNVPFAGTTLLIAVGVGLETLKQIDSQLTMRNYDGFLR